MDSKSDWAQFLKVYPMPNERNRVWTLQEAFGNGVQFTNYEGEGGKDKDWIIEKSPANEFKPGNYDAVSEKLEGVRDMNSCATAGVLTYLANAFLNDAKIISTVVQTFVVFAFDSSIICDDPANPTGVCLNLLKIIGGVDNSGDGGLIGTLTSSIYMPLLVIAVTITAFWIGYKGLVQRKLREAMFGAIWVCLSVIFGLALLLNPALLAKAPMAVSNSVASCVIGSFSGQNCMDGSSGTASLQTDSFSTSSDKICRSLAPGAALDAQMSMTVNSLSCTIWKAFVLEPYAQGAFGTSFGNLDTVADTPTKKVIQKAGLDPETFCVNLGSSESLASFSGKRAVFDRDSGKVCNLLAYQMFLQTNSSTTGSVTPASDKIDPRWYNVVVTAANDEGLWAQWAPSMTNSMHKVSTGILASVTGLIGGFVLVVIAFFALVYYLTSVILMAFSPLFLLMGVHPGRGKKILLGWLEKVVSNILKYLASAMFLIVSVSFYAAILGAASSPPLTFLFVIIVSGALYMYRKEIVDLIGKASMGGEQLSSKFADSLKDRAAGVGGLAMAGVGSGVGAAIAGGRVSSGIKAGIQRDLQRGGATKVFGKVGGELVGNATRQFARNTVDNERDVKEEARRAMTQANAAEAELDTVAIEQDSAVSEIAVFDANLFSNLNTIDALSNSRDIYTGLENEAAREMFADNPYFAQAQLLLNQMSALEFEKNIAIASGDTETADLKIAEIQQLSGQRATLLNQIDSEDLTRNREEYNARLDEKLFTSNVQYGDQEKASLIKLTASMDNAQAARDELVDSANRLTTRRGELEANAAGFRATEETLNNRAMDIQPGDMVTKKKADDMIAEGNKAGLVAQANAFVERPIAEKLSMDEVYEAERQRAYGGSPTNSSSPQTNNRPDDDTDPGGSRQTGPERGPQGSSPGGVPTPQVTPAPTRPLPTSPQSSSSTSEAPTTERIPEQRERNTGVPTRPASENREPVISPQPLPEPSRPAQPVQAPSVPSQPVNSPSAPAQPSSPPVQQTNSSPVPAPNPPAREPSVPAQPAATPRIPTQPAQGPAVPAQPEQAPASPSQPTREPAVPAQPVQTPAVPSQPTATPRIPTQPAQGPTVPSRPAQEPIVPARPERDPNSPMVRDRSDRGAPLIQSDNETPTRGIGLPRRRGPGNN